MSGVNSADYCFAVIEEASDRSVELEIRRYDDVAKQHFQSVWQRLYTALQNHSKICNRAVPGWALWKPWEWGEQRKTGYEPRNKLAGWCGDIPVGFLNVWADVPSTHQPDKKLLYIEHLAAAPGNLVTELWHRRFKALGGALFAYAVLLSDQLGFEGRLGLHVADESALAFYRYINLRCENSLLCPERTDVKGPTPRGEHDIGKTYLETTEIGAKRWLGEYRLE